MASKKPYLQCILAAAVVATLFGMYYDHESTTIVLVTILKICKGAIAAFVRNLINFGLWAGEQVNLGLTLRDATPCSAYMCLPDEKIAGLFMNVFHAQTALFDCAPIQLTATNSNFITRNLEFLTNSPRATQLKCMTSHDLNGDARRTCFATDELPPCKGAVSWSKIEEDLRDLINSVQNAHPTCNAANAKEQGSNTEMIASDVVQKQHWLASVPSAGRANSKAVVTSSASSSGNLVCDNIGTKYEIFPAEAEEEAPWKVAMKKLIEEWAKDVSWADVLEQPRNFCKYTTLTSSSIVKMSVGYCPVILKQIADKLQAVVKVIKSNEKKHAKMIEITPDSLSPPNKTDEQ